MKYEERKEVLKHLSSSGDVVEDVLGFKGSDAHSGGEEERMGEF